MNGPKHNVVLTVPSGPFSPLQIRLLDRHGVYDFDRFSGGDYTYTYRDELCKESQRLFDMRPPRDQNITTGFVSCEFDGVMCVVCTACAWCSSHTMG
jgi:hypothetical protein